MSFITKRERVFNEYQDPFELPARNEGKLKAYASCTDARAWSHFCSDKTEHLIEIIKKNNEICRGKYVPINVIIKLVMSAKNAEIVRLKRKIGQMEQMISAFDQLELSCEQQCEIANAHAMIKNANKSLDDLPPLELDMSGFTEGIDSEYFMTGKSGGDDGMYRGGETQRTGREAGFIGPNGKTYYVGVDGSMRAPDGSVMAAENKLKGPDGKFYVYEGSGRLKAPDGKVFSMGADGKLKTPDGQLLEGKASKMFQTDLSERCKCDVSTSAVDSRIEELQETLVSKEAKLSAMQNTLAVMENDVCEPYCVYAHIYTALEKIYGTLRQNDKYRLFLDLMSSGKDLRCLDIKGKILFKLKILEKFSVALLAPCSERFKHDETCECYSVQVSQRVEANFLIAQPDSVPNSSDKIRSQLVADIMENEEMKEILKEESEKNEDERANEEARIFEIMNTDVYSVSTGNINRLKALQDDYDELINCYEQVKLERDNLITKCQNYEALEKDLKDCKSKLAEYNMLYSEREYYRKRSESLDNLKEQYMLLADETTSIETQLKAEAEINHIKTGTIEQLRGDNILLEKKLNDLTIAFERDKNSVLCKLKEAECKIMCQEQQIKSLSNQIDKILAEGIPQESISRSAAVVDEIEELKDHIKSLNNALYASEDEKQQLQIQFEDKLKLINELKVEIDEWKSSCEKAAQRNDYLEKYTEGFREEVRRLVEENKALSQEVEEKSSAVANLIGVFNNKSQEVERLNNDIETIRKENNALQSQLQDNKDVYRSSLMELKNANEEVEHSLKISKKESEELLEKMKDYNDLSLQKEEIAKALVTETESCNELRIKLVNTLDENEKLRQDLICNEKNNSILLQEIQRLREINSYAADNINTLQMEKEQYRMSYEVTKKESVMMEDKLKEFDDLRNEIHSLRLSQERIIAEKQRLENELQGKVKDLNDAKKSVELTRKESELLLEKIQNSDNLKEDMIKLSKDYRNLVDEKQKLQQNLNEKNKELDLLLETLSHLRTKNEELSQKCEASSDYETQISDLKKAYQEITKEKNALQFDHENKIKEINNLNNDLQKKIEENNDLANRFRALEDHHVDSINKLEDFNLSTQTTLKLVRRESEALLDKVKDYDALLSQYEELKQSNDHLKHEKDILQVNYENQLKKNKKAEDEKRDLEEQVREIMLQNENIERALINARKDLIKCTSENPYDSILMEIEELKKEKMANRNRIRELCDKLDDSDNIISTLKGDVLARDDRIAMLENHINSLEDEMRQLHQVLDQVVETGEQIKDNSLEKIDKSLSKLEAHHSKAAHNMKMEIAKLKNDNAKLENKLSFSKIKSEESFRDKNKYLSEIINLQNDREIIVTEIKKLELSSMGDSILSPVECTVEDVLRSLDKVRKCIEARQSKSASLEQTLLKVQSSSQLLLTKADEAKRIVEKEKQKLLKEKDEVIADKLNMERQLLNLKLQLEEQTSRSEEVIRDLESEILNQKLIIDKLNNSRQDFISKLEEEIKSLRDLYQNSIKKINELKDELGAVSKENSENMKILDKTKLDLLEKSKEVSNLQKEIEDLNNKSMKDIEVQVGGQQKKKIAKSQTEEILENNVDNEKLDNKADIISEKENQTRMKLSVKLPYQNLGDSDSRQQQPNEMQVLRATVEPDFEYIKKTYVNYKKNRLSPGIVENFSSEVNASETSQKKTSNTKTSELFVVDESSSYSPHFVDIYSRQLDMKSASSKVTENEPPSQTFDFETKHLGEFSQPNNGGKSSEIGDLFLIYKDSKDASQSHMYKSTTNSPHEILVETATVHRNRDLKKNPLVSRVLSSSSLKYEEAMSYADKDSNLNKDEIQTRLDIAERLNDESAEAFGPDLKTERKEKMDEQLSKSDELQSSSKTEKDGEKPHKRYQKNKQRSFGLDYILNSIKQELGSENASSSNKIRSSFSDDLYKQLKHSSASVIPGSPEYSTGKTVSLPSPTKWSEHSNQREMSDQSVTVNIDASDYYENKIRYLSQQLVCTKRDYEMKIHAVKIQYDNNIKNIINEHNLGVKSIQNLHEDTLQDIIKIHENEVESLRSMSIEAVRKAERLEKENQLLRTKVQSSCACGCLDKEPIRMLASEEQNIKIRNRGDTRKLTKTNVEAFNVRPKLRSTGPCTCSLDVNVMETIRQIFEQVDQEQRKLSEHTYLKHIVKKIMVGSFESLDISELSFLHLKVCRTWKHKLNKEEMLQKQIHNMESELSKQCYSKQHFEELDRKVAEERHRLQEAREAVCPCSLERKDSPDSPSSLLAFLPSGSSDAIPSNTLVHSFRAEVHPKAIITATQNPSKTCIELNERRSAGDLVLGISGPGLKLKPPKAKPESRATLAKLDVEERRGKKLYDEPPTRLRRTHDRPSRGSRK